MAGLFDDLIPGNQRVTTYSPQRGGDRMEGGYEASRPGPDGQAMVRTLEDFRSGRAPYVTIAGNPQLYGREYTIPEVSYSVGGQPQTLRNVPVVVHDTGGAFRNAPEGRFDVPIGRDLGARDTNQGLSGVQFVPRSEAMAYTADPPRPAGVQAIDAAMRPQPAAAPQSVPQAAPQVQQGLFDDLIPAAPQATAGLFDDLIPPTPPPPQQPAPSGMWNNLTAGLNDAIYSVAGAPVDAATWVVNRGIHGINALTGSELPDARGFGGSRSLARAGASLGVNDPAQVQANSMEEKLARAAGAGIGGMLAPEAALGVLGRAGVVGEGAMNAAAPFIGRSGSVSDVAVNAGVGAAAGVGGQMAGNVVPEPWKPLAETAGNLVGGGLGAGALAGARGLAQAPQAWRDFRMADPATQEAAAGRRLADAATDPSAARAALDTAHWELVRGSQPTTFQMTGDMGIGGLERASASQFPAEFNARRAEQNAARVGALEGIQPAGAPEQVVQVLRQNLSNLDLSLGKTVDDAMKAAQAATDKLGGTGTPEGYGLRIRQQVAEARQAVKAREDALWDAVDPNGSLNLNVTDTRQTARDIVKSLEKSAKPFGGEEAGSLGIALQYPDVITFREMVALRRRVNDALTDELSKHGKNVVYGRLSRLRGAIERDIEGAVAAKADLEQRAVQAGAMSEMDTMAAALQRRVDDWRTNQATAEAGRSDAAGAGIVGTASAALVPPGSGGAGQARGRSSNTSRDQGVQGAGLFPENLVPNFDEGAAGRLKDASAATKQRSRTYDEGPVGETLRGAASDHYTLPAGVVPGRFFRPGPRGFEAMQDLKNAYPGAMAQIGSYAIATLRRDAMLPDGTLDPSKVQRWRQTHADALRAIPEIDKMVADPIKASETLARLAALRKEQIDSFQKGAVGRLLNLDDPADVTRTIGGIFSRQDQVQQMARLARETAGNQQAREGLRKAVADYIATRFVGNIEGGTSNVDLMRSDAFQQFLRQSAPALKHVLSGEEMAGLHAIAADLKRANRSLTAVKIPGQSNTVQDALATAKSGTDAQSWLSRLLSPGALAGAGAAAGSVVGGGLGAAAGGGLGAHFGRVIEALRKSGLQSVDEIVRDALLNPDRARALLAKVSDRPTKTQAINLARVYMRAALLPALGN
ncbi:hypothetical protein [Xanthobacter sp. VNH20]|uniref:hypothetical protein n=1 Tax=Xanthobacter sp. VNH20 TaxID=3156616 RepID=UPI0032B60072